MSQQNENVVYERITVEQFRERAKEDPEYSIDVFTNGISMWPLLRCYEDYVKIVYPNRELAVGDVILFYRADGREIAHRICWLDADNVQTIGDNCDRKDEVIPRSSVIGLVTHTCKKGHLRHIDTPFWIFYGKFMMWSNPVRMFIRNRLYRPARALARKIIKGK